MTFHDADCPAWLTRADPVRMSDHYSRRVPHVDDG
jgi:hypothetical protein